jgi:hypothetical protein
MKPKGISLLETVLYIGILMIALPTFILFVMQLWQNYTLLDARSRMEQTAATIFQELEHTITEADSINISGSTLGSDNSLLKFRDGTGQLITIDRPAVAVTLAETVHSVRRLRMQKGSEAAFFMTDPEIDVTVWRVDAVRSGSTLTGLKIVYDTAMLNPGAGPYRNSSFGADTTFALSAHTIEN